MSPRFVLATTEGWQAPDDMPTPESILEHWSEVMANQDLQEPVGSMSDLLGRRGLHPYNMAELVQWAQDRRGPDQADVSFAHLAIGHSQGSKSPSNSSLPFVTRP